MILNILDSPGNFTTHEDASILFALRLGYTEYFLDRYAACVILTFTYGKRTPTTLEDPDLQDMIRDRNRFRVVILPGAYLVDTFPVLRWLPGYLSELRRWHRDSIELCCRCLGSVQTRIEGGDDIPECFATDLLGNEKMSFDQAACLTGSMFYAGASITAAALVFVIMAAACFPDAAKVVQEEIDEVVSRDRCPKFEDRERLLQVIAFAYECFRWRPLVPSEIAHVASQDIIWQGYVSPKGATIISSPGRSFVPLISFLAPRILILRDGSLMGTRGRISNNSCMGSVEGGVLSCTTLFFKSVDSLLSFRVCPGSHIANRSLFINTALLL
ncbi:cytochrome P450 [Armillaria luteobubalina]|uniref:Cytochrome P450 n=1 Tax=Armillaria luteobubalina TaxID=153913 RepID=A0AA39PLW7_9AGAR|nr:cytochrome P450 [Armillaria luteobubalina]